MLVALFKVFICYYCTPSMNGIVQLLARNTLMGVWTVFYMYSTWVILITRSARLSLGSYGMLHMIFDTTEREDVTLGDVLQFLSGASKIPAMGFDTTPKIRFTNEKCLPRVSICDLCITFPREMGLVNYADFKERMDLCILGSFGFGSV